MCDKTQNGTKLQFFHVFLVRTTQQTDEMNSGNPFVISRFFSLWGGTGMTLVLSEFTALPKQVLKFKQDTVLESAGQV